MQRGGYTLQLGPTEAYGRKETSTNAEVWIRSHCRPPVIYINLGFVSVVRFLPFIPTSSSISDMCIFRFYTFYNFGALSVSIFCAASTYICCDFPIYILAPPPPAYSRREFYQLREMTSPRNSTRGPHPPRAPVIILFINIFIFNPHIFCHGLVGLIRQVFRNFRFFGVSILRRNDGRTTST